MMKHDPIRCWLLLMLPSLAFCLTMNACPAQETVFEEYDGLLAVEAEHFFDQTQTEVRKFYLTSKDQVPDVAPDGDPAHLDGAGNHAYLEILPDTRRTHDDKLVKGENFSPQPGKQAVLHYRVKINQPGRYYVWVRAYSTGSEDNGLHVGLNGKWPASGQRLQWCEGKRTWRWESKQRTEQEHCGEPHKIFLDIEEAGLHTIQFSMREDGFEFDKWLITTNRDFARPKDAGPMSKFTGPAPTEYPAMALPAASGPKKQGTVDQVEGEIDRLGELKTWHTQTFSCVGPFAEEVGGEQNPFLDYRLTFTFKHQDGTVYRIPGYFAADGNAANTSAKSGNIWRVKFSPDRPGKWDYQVAMVRGPLVAVDDSVEGQPVDSLNGQHGTFEVSESDKSGRDLRAHGRLLYVGKRYLQFAGSKKWFLKFGADAPETLLAFADFDDTVAPKKNSPLKQYQPHLADWKAGDPTWRDGKGKGLIGAINYLASKNANAFSFLTYNAGGDGDNVWPFVSRDDQRHYDCSKLDQWEIVFDHASQQGMYLHFKMQETEIDDNRRGQQGRLSDIPESLNNGDLGIERKMYLRELVARFGHHLALNWNLGEENTQSTDQQQAMIDYLRSIDAYQHPIVLHTFPVQQDKVYRPLLGDQSKLTGLSLQNDSIDRTHQQTLKWIRESVASGKPWIVAFDESGSAAHGQPPDLGYEDFFGRDRKGDWAYTEHEVRHLTLWGHLMAGGAGCEYYFGYQLPQNDLQCEDWRSRDRSWEYGSHALQFFHHYEIPFWEMENANALVGNNDQQNDIYCLAKPGSVYVVYDPVAGLQSNTRELDLAKATGEFSVQWFNPRTGGALQAGSIKSVSGGAVVKLGRPPVEENNLGANTNDWVILVRKKK